MTDLTEVAAAVTLEQRALVAFGLKDLAAARQELTQLVLQSKHIATITNVDGYEQCKRARITLKNKRVEIEKRGKGGRDEVNKAAKAISAIENDLVGVTQPEETRLDGLQQIWDDELERQHREEVERERLRMEELRGRIAGIERLPLAALGKTSEQIQGLIDGLDAFDVETLGELRDVGAALRGVVILQLRDMHSQSLATEAETARLQAMRDDLARQHREQVARHEELEREGAAIRQRQEEEACKAAPPAPSLVAEPSGPPCIALPAGARLIPSRDDIVKVVAQYYNVADVTARRWLCRMDFNEAAAA